MPQILNLIQHLNNIDDNFIMATLQWTILPFFAHVAWLSSTVRTDLLLFRWN